MCHQIKPTLRSMSLGNHVTALCLYPSAQRRQLTGAAAVRAHPAQQLLPLHRHSQHEQRGQSLRMEAVACHSAAWAPPPQLKRLPSQRLHPVLHSPRRPPTA